MREIVFRSEPPGRFGTLERAEREPVYEACREHPYEWTLLKTKINPRDRSTIQFVREAGADFVFKTYWNPDTELVEVWCSYSPNREDGS